MADILGSLLPEGYAAPEVQSILGGELARPYCNNGGEPTGTDATCNYGSKPVEP